MAQKPMLRAEVYARALRPIQNVKRTLIILACVQHQIGSIYNFSLTLNKLPLGLGEIDLAMARFTHRDLFD
jgi:hypothetical protein